MNDTHSQPVDVQQMINWVAGGERPADQLKIGTEHEKFLFHRQDLSSVAYAGETGVGALLERLLTELGPDAEPILEKGTVIGIRDSDGGSVTLEPGGQLELSGAPLDNLHETCRETGRHLRHMREAGKPLDIGMLGIGFHPTARCEDISFMPKGRYQIMSRHMPKVGTLGLDMMLRSCTVQVNLDYTDEADMRQKFRTSLALQPLATALFANSPFKDGQLSGLLSTRAHAWTDTDAARCGVPACVFDPYFGYEQWIDYILDVPMYFLHRGDDYIDVAGQSFRDFLDGMLEGHEGQFPSMADFEDHITTAFPEVRMKTFLEMRGADGGPWSNICALPAFWVGLLPTSVPKMLWRHVCQHRETGFAAALVHGTCTRWRKKSSVFQRTACAAGHALMTRGMTRPNICHRSSTLLPGARHLPTSFWNFTTGNGRAM